MWGGCATFIPGDNEKVYIIGGYQDALKTLITNKMYVYDLSNDDYELIGESAMPLANHGCVGLRNEQNQKVI